MENFWTKLKRPFFVLAPMADVTDFAFRQMFARYGKPDVTFTEFVSADGLANDKGREVLIKELRFLDNERPIVAQIFGANPENIRQAAGIIARLGFDGVDINMGCPDKAVLGQGAGAALIKNPRLAREIIRAAKEGAPDIPVSVKTRIGFNQIETEKWIGELCQERPAALTVHGRTKKEMSEVDAHWDEIAKAAAIAQSRGIVFIGNGDVQSVADGTQKAARYQTDGIMVGRGVFGNPWFFSSKVRRADLTLAERFGVMLEHARFFEQELSQKNVKGFHVLKKHFKAYVSGFDGARELRTKLMESANTGEVEEILREYFGKN